MELEDLQTFVEVADAGGVSPAARRLGVSKSIVSRRLVRLEEELGIQLLARTTRGAALTEAGVTFRNHAARSAPKLILRERRSCLRASCAADYGSPRHYLSVPAIWHLCLHSSSKDHPPLNMPWLTFDQNGWR